jgi:hypothetical protein
VLGSIPALPERSRVELRPLTYRLDLSKKVIGAHWQEH